MVLLGLFAIAVTTLRTSTPDTIAANHVLERTLVAAIDRDDPFNQIEVTANVTDSHGRTFVVPAFWDGGRTWKFRFASPNPGRFHYRTTCTDPHDSGLQGIEGGFEIVPYRGSNPLYRHGPVRVAPGRRHFEHADGTPFFWLGDTWWMGLTKRLEWPDEFARLAGDRIAKGFNVIQIVAGLYPDMPAFDERGANEAGYPWARDYSRIEPAYFDAADRRIAYLVDHGLSPCIVGAWGYHLPWMGADRLKMHWRYLVARYGAYPAFWCVAGEANLPYYLAPGFPFDDREQVKGWTGVGAYLRSIDPYHRPISIHPTGLGHLDARHAIDDVSLLDFDMLQTGHGDRGSLKPTVDAARTAESGKPAMPWLNSEVCYEGILGACYDDVQRLMFWSCVLSGAAGHTYGANGIWQLNRKGAPYGKSPHGGDYGPVPWDEAMTLPGSAQLGQAKAFLSKFDWWKLKPNPSAAAYAENHDVHFGDWIWYPDGNPAIDAPVGTRYFRLDFALSGLSGRDSVTRATVRITADDRFKAYVNGHQVGEGADWRKVQVFDVTSRLVEGSNVLAVEAANAVAPVAKNPAGLLCTLDITYASGKRWNARSNNIWRCMDRLEPGWEQIRHDWTQWPHAISVAPYGGGPWGRAGDQDSYLSPYAADLPGGALLVYVPSSEPIVATGSSDNSVQVERYNAVTSRRIDIQRIKSDASGGIRIEPPPGAGDWLVLVRPISGSHRRSQPQISQARNHP